MLRGCSKGYNQQIVLSESKSYSEAKIVALFEKYKDASEDFILSEGIEEFCIHLQLKPDEFKVLGKMADCRQIIYTFLSVLKINFSFQFSLGNLRQSRCVVSQDQNLLTVNQLLNPVL